MRRDDIAPLLTTTAACVLALPFFLLVVTSILLAAGAAVSWFNLPLALVPWAAFTAWTSSSPGAVRPRTRAVLALAATAAALAFAVTAEALVYDSSWDGQAYHALAIQRVTDGWNPVREPVPAVPAYADELTFFAKGPWFLAAAVAAAFGSVDAGKFLHLYAMVAVFLFWAGALLPGDGIGRRWVLLAVVPVVLNPVAGAQVFTNYVDGVLASFIAIVVILLIQTARDGPPHSRDGALPALAMAVALAVSTKLNGALYIAILCAGYLAWALASRRARPRAAAGWAAAGILVAVLVISWNPYMSRFAAGTVRHGSPFHPHGHWSEIVNVESEVLLPGMGRLERLARSLTARSVIWTDAGPAAKVPFRVHRDELRQFASPDVRFGGFGPLFSGGLVLALATLAVLLRDPGRRLLPHAGPLVMAGLIGLSVLSFPEAWWARLAPQLAFAPVLVGLAGLAARAGRRTVWLPRTLILVLGINAVLVTGAHAYHAIDQSAASRRQLAGIRTAERTLAVSGLDGFPGVRHRLQRAGVRFREVDALPCAAGQRVVLTLEIEACLLPGDGSP